MKARVLPPGSLSSYLRRPTPSSPSIVAIFIIPSLVEPVLVLLVLFLLSACTFTSTVQLFHCPAVIECMLLSSCSTATCCWVDCATPAQSHTFNNRHRHSMQRKEERTVRQSAVLGSDGASSPPLLFDERLASADQYGDAAGYPSPAGPSPPPPSSSLNSLFCASRNCT